jgi:hypothetical protein
MQQRLCLRDIIDCTERVQRTRSRIPDFVNARSDRGLDIVIATSPRISLPFAPGRDHLKFSAARGAMFN